MRPWWARAWLVPDLVDAHTHPGAVEPDQPMDERLHQHVDAGVTLIRSPGLPGEPPPWFGEDTAAGQPGPEVVPERRAVAAAAAEAGVRVPAGTDSLPHGGSSRRSGRWWPRGSGRTTRRRRRRGARGSTWDWVPWRRAPRRRWCCAAGACGAADERACHNPPRRFVTVLDTEGGS
ncbi:hypothetical protein ACWED2_00160 [Amycolatopsis sp. NPDC005003]